MEESYADGIVGICMQYSYQLLVAVKIIPKIAVVVLTG